VTAPFVTTLRTHRAPLHAGAPGAAPWTLRVEVPDVWDAVTLEAAPGASVAGVKHAALEALYPSADPAAFVTKLNGIEVLNESVSVREAGALDGSIFLVTFRRRRPVR
jgi:hypothetical protein